MKSSIYNANKNRGRPRKARGSEADRKNIKAKIQNIYHSFPLFYEEAFAEAVDPKYNGYKQPGDLETVKSAFVHFFSGSRSLPELYRQVLEDLLAISHSAQPPLKGLAVSQPENPSAFVLTTKKDKPQWADCRQINLGGGLLEVLKCRIETQSPYFRFGFKLLKENERLFGDGSIKSQDANLVIHISRNNWSRRDLGISAKDIFFTWYLNGVSLETDKRLFSVGRRLSATIELKIDSSYVATFSINGICCLNRVIPPGICRRVAVFAWGDREEFAVEVSELLVNPASVS